MRPRFAISAVSAVPIALFSLQYALEQPSESGSCDPDGPF
jgi:hypothetical protein